MTTDTLQIPASGVLLCVLAVFPFTSYSQDAFTSLEDEMTVSEFRQAGLDKLSPEEIQALNRWLRKHLGAEQEIPDHHISNNDVSTEQANGPTGHFPPQRMGFSDFKGEEKKIESVIIGTFSGWRGNTRFELENGMVWEQVERDLLSVPPRENQRVVISPGFLSSWYLEVDGINKRLRVTRVR